MTPPKARPARTAPPGSRSTTGPTTTSRTDRPRAGPIRPLGTPAAMTDGRMGLVLRDPLPWSDALRVVRTAEASGYEAVFVPEIQAREAFATLTGFARRTERSAGNRRGDRCGRERRRSTAMAAATVHDVTGGRIILGIGRGRGGEPPASGRAAPALRPLALTEEYTRVVRGALAGERVASEMFGVPGSGSGCRSRGSRAARRVAGRAGRPHGGARRPCRRRRPAELVHARTRVGGAPRRSPRRPRRPGATRRADDGGLRPGCLEVGGGRRAGAAPSDDRPVRVVSARTARRWRRWASGPRPRPPRRPTRAGRPGDVPESLVRALTVLGGREEALGEVRAYREAGADLVLCYPVVAGDQRSPRSWAPPWPPRRRPPLER